MTPESRLSFASLFADPTGKLPTVHTRIRLLILPRRDWECRRFEAEQRHLYSRRTLGESRCHSSHALGSSVHLTDLHMNLVRISRLGAIEDDGCRSTGISAEQRELCSTNQLPEVTIKTDKVLAEVDRRSSKPRIRHSISF